jgi:hypothetical protein
MSKSHLGHGFFPGLFLSHINHEKKNKVYFCTRDLLNLSLNYFISSPVLTHYYVVARNIIVA